MNVMLSVDFDFFIRNEGDAAGNKMLVAHPGTRNQRTIAAIGVFDWGSSESFAPGLQAIQWMSRYSAIRNVGYDPVALVNNVPEKGCVTPAKFAFEIGRRFSGATDAELLISDSHAFGLSAASYARRNIGWRTKLRVVHFDAHADLGYGDVNYENEWKRTHSCDCGSWLWAAFRSGLIDGADIVYPDWKGTDEFDLFRYPAHIKPYRRKIKVFTWSDWLKSKPVATRVALTHLCRSSAWVPPWCDELFKKLISHLPFREMTCLDCAGELITGGQKIGAHDACTPRHWSREEYEQFCSATLSQHIVTHPKDLTPIPDRVFGG